MHSSRFVGRFVEVSTALLAEGYGVRFRASGGSMRPAICDGDFITVAPAGAAAVTPGNVIVYRDCDRLFAHRIVSVAPGPEGDSRMVLRGDAVAACDAPVSTTQVVGHVVGVRRRQGARLSDVPAIVVRLFRGLRHVYGV
jgi:signal peptidase I